MSTKKSKTPKPADEIASIVNTLPAIPSEIVITNDQEFDQARAKYKEIRETEARLLAKKRAILDPLNTAISELKTLFKPAETRILALGEAFSLELGRYANSREIARLKALEKLNSDKRIKNVDTIQDKREEIGNRMGGTMRIKKLVITDPTKIPKAYWIIDEKKLKDALIGGKVIKGAKIVEELTVTAR